MMMGVVIAALVGNMICSNTLRNKELTLHTGPFITTANDNFESFIFIYVHLGF